LIPELRKRGLFWDDYAVDGGTYRENLRAQKGGAHPSEDHPASKYQWRVGVPEEEAVIPPEPELVKTKEVTKQSDGPVNGHASTPKKRAAESVHNGGSGRRKSARHSR
jgi:hypothetical protein